ncbi:hypothetical protein Dsin_015098 [Dipteronia sinensis]|uniref:Uncharacterized protein n=1 Tax=Dipteronia sinensis TaxID=43782 RepID=A0AAE0AN54_9ROSI|nr:hypothetical protein Dsin_015098 [Dipteronia sinensis]
MCSCGHFQIALYVDDCVIECRKILASHVIPNGGSGKLSFSVKRFIQWHYFWGQVMMSFAPRHCLLSSINGGGDGDAAGISRIDNSGSINANVYKLVDIPE